MWHKEIIFVSDAQVPLSRALPFSPPAKPTTAAHTPLWGQREPLSGLHAPPAVSLLREFVQMVLSVRLPVTLSADPELVCCLGPDQRLASTWHVLFLAHWRPTLPPLDMTLGPSVYQS